MKFSTFDMNTGLNIEVKLKERRGDTLILERDDGILIVRSKSRVSPLDAEAEEELDG